MEVLQRRQVLHKIEWNLLAPLPFDAKILFQDSIRSGPTTPLPSSDVKFSFSIRPFAEWLLVIWGFVELKRRTLAPNSAHLHACRHLHFLHD
jgi:hypothetical protein